MELYVAKNGKDTNQGTSKFPLATIEEARESTAIWLCFFCETGVLRLAVSFL